MSTKGPSSEEAEYKAALRRYQALLRESQEVVRQSIATGEAMSKALDAEMKSRPTLKVRTPARQRDPKMDELNKAQDRELELKDDKEFDEKVKNLRL